jgi:hypothetical protein
MFRTIYVRHCHFHSLIPTGSLRSLLFIRSLFQHCVLKTRKTHFFKTLVKNICGPSLKLQHVSENICPSFSLSLLIPTGALRSLLFIRSLFQHYVLKTRKTHFFKTLVKNICGPSLKFQQVSDNVCPSSGSLKCS